MPDSITDDDIRVLKKFNAQTPFILYNYEERPSSDVFAYLEDERTLQECLQSIGMTKELKEYLCECCFYKVKQTKNKTLELTPKNKK